MLNRRPRFSHSGCQLAQQWCRKVFGALLVLSCVLLSGGVQADGAVRLVPGPDLPQVAVALERDMQELLQARGVLRLGVSAGYEPLSLVRGASVKGIMVDYLAIIGASLGLTLEVQVYPDWPAAIAALRSGEVDVLGRGSSYEAQLFPELLLTSPYALNQPVLVGRASDLGAEQALSKGKLAVVEGYAVVDSELLTRFPNAEVDLFATTRDALHAVEYQHYRWLVSDAVTAAYNMSLGELPSLRMRPLANWQPMGYSFLLRATDQPLHALFNRVLENIPQLARANILSRWGGAARFDSVQPPRYNPEELRWLATRPEVRVLVSGEAPPYSFFDDEGNFRGLLADLLAEISQQSGLRFSLVQASSEASALEVLQEGGAELAGMKLPTDSQRRSLGFTEPVVSASFALVGAQTSSVQGLDDLKGKRVAVQNESEVTAFLRARYPSLQLVVADNNLDSLVAVAKGDVDAAILLLPVSRYLINQYFAKDLRVITSLPQLQSQLGFAVSKEMPLLSGVMETTLDQFEPRMIANLVARWQNSMPAEASVWAGYEQRLHWFALTGGGFLCLFLAWQTFAYFRRVRNRAEEGRLAFRSALLDGIPQAVVVLDLQGRFLLCNHTFYTVFGLQPAEVIGHAWREVKGLDASQEPSWGKIHQALLDGKDSIDVQQVELSIHGEPFIFRQWAVPHRGSDGRIAGILMGWIDISTIERLLRQLQIMRDQAVEASAAKSHFLAVMSHEIRTPLNAIIGLLELTMERVDRGEEWDRPAIEVAYSSSNALMLLIGDILDLAKIESGKLTLEPQRNSPREILETAQRVFHGLARQKGLYLQVELQLDSTRDVLVDGGRLKQVLSNLIGNAIKFTDQGGVKVSLRVHEVGVYLLMKFVVEDSGIGISAADQQLLFEPFSQAKGHAGQRGGTGLGLVICQQLIEMMGGSLQLDSELGRGTRITATLRAPTLDEQSSVALSSTEVEPQAPVLRVLLVDDHPANRLLLGQQLKFLGHSVVESEDGQQAFARLQSEPFDVVITDCNMPVMDGYELTRRVRAGEHEVNRTPRLIVGFTANAQVEERQRCLAVGMNDCLFKPVSLSMLKSCLGKVSQHQTGVLESPAARVVDSQARVFDLEMLESLTGGDRKLTRMLFNELHTSNSLDLRQFDELMAAGRVRNMGQLVHRLKGAARMVGAQVLSDAALVYEEGLAQSVADEEISARAGNVRAAVQQLQEAVASWMAAAD